MRTLVVCLIMFGSVALGQTVIDSRQSVQLAALPQESKWCPGPIFTVTSPKTLVVGKNWTATTPCIARFNITPIQVTDPVVLAKFTSPVTVTLSATVTTDDLYFWITSPAPPGTPGIVVGQKLSTSVATCSGCAIVTQATTPRQFPAMVMPIGFIPVIGGALFEQGYDMMSSQQFSLAQGVVAIVRRDQDGYTVRLESAGSGTPAAASLTSASISALQSESVRNRATLAQLDMIARGTRVESIDHRVTQLQNKVATLEATTPPASKELYEAKEALSRAMYEMQPQVERMIDSFREREMMSHDRIESLRHEAIQQLSYDARAWYEGFKVPAPKDMSDPCTTSQFAYDGEYKYECMVEGWIRFKVQRPKISKSKGKAPTKAPGTNVQTAQRTR